MNRVRWGVVAVVGVFLATRALLDLGLTPHFSYDTYKYLHAADSLWSGAGWPPLFTSGNHDGEWLATFGGVLHVVPGYVGVILLVWGLASGVTLVGITLVQSCMALGVYAFAAWTIGQRAGAGAGLLVLAVLCLSPTVAWLEHMVMPASIATVAVMASACLAVSTEAEGRLRGAAGAVLAGLALSASVLLRASSLGYVPLPAAIALLGHAPWRRKLAWLSLYAAATLLPLVPWAVHNHAYHGVYRLTASTGRNLYFSALWSGTVDRAEAASRLGIRVPPGARSTQKIANAEFISLLRSGHSPVEADAVLLTRGLEAYGKRDLATLVSQRTGLLIDLFSARSLRSHRVWFLANTAYRGAVLEEKEHAYRHPVTPELRRVFVASRRAPGFATGFVTAWSVLLTFDRIPLLLAYLAALPILLLRRGRDWQLFLTVAGPPLLFFGVYAIFGSPTYRYEIQLHPFMQATVALAAWRLVERARRRGAEA